MTLKRIIVFSVITVLSVIVIYFLYQNYSLGSRDEREEILTAVTFDLSENRGIKQEEIEEIYVIRSYAGVYPFYYQVTVDLKNDVRIWYQWADKEKTKVKSLSDTEVK